ncbi:MAG: hypothetical protein U1E87_08700 [Alphaproteobacteria bacterium]
MGRVRRCVYQAVSLNLVDFIGTETAGEFEVFGESDEAFRIEGGSSALPDALLARLGDNVRLRPGAALAARSTRNRAPGSICRSRRRTAR